MCVCFFSYPSVCFRKTATCFLFPEPSIVSAHIGAFVAWMNLILGRRIPLLITGWLGWITSFREHHGQISSCLFRGLQCHFSWNNFDEYLLINWELIFFIYKHLNPLCEELLTSPRLGDKKGASPVVGLCVFHHIQVLFPQGFSLSSLGKHCFLGEPHKNKLQI